MVIVADRSINDSINGNSNNNNNSSSNIILHGCVLFLTQRYNNQ